MNPSVDENEDGLATHMCGEESRGVNRDHSFHLFHRFKPLSPTIVLGTANESPTLGIPVARFARFGTRPLRGPGVRQRAEARNHTPYLFSAQASPSGPGPLATWPATFQAMRSMTATEFVDPTDTNARLPLGSI